MTEEIKIPVVMFVIILLIMVGMGTLLGYSIWEHEKVEYDPNCLDRLANDICIEEGYESGGDYKSKVDSFYCDLDERQDDWIVLKWLEGEKETCEVCYNSTSEGCHA